MPVTFTWTHSGNYSASPTPWGGQPLSLQPVVTYYTPNQKLPAEEINYSYGQIATDLASLQTQLVNVAGFSRFTGSGTWTAPAGCNSALIMGCGGGGGGEGGYAGNANGLGTSNIYCQGAGGSGAPLTVAKIMTTPGAVYTVTVGAGGSGGAAGAYPNGSSSGGAQGGDGGTSSVLGVVNFITTGLLLQGGVGGGSGPGGQGRFGIASWTWPTTAIIATPGGRGVAGAPRPLPLAAIASMGAYCNPRYGASSEPGAGGHVVCAYNNTYQASGDGNQSITGCLGGTAGSTGGTSSVYAGGSGGGGGGGGPACLYLLPYTGGGNGGNGGNGNNGGSGAGGGAGQDGGTSFGYPHAANTGSGGGGGGSGGFGSGGGGSGGHGGQGDNGFVWIFWTANGA